MSQIEGPQLSEKRRKHCMLNFYNLHCWHTTSQQLVTLWLKL